MLDVRLISGPSMPPVQLIALAARTCYSSKPYDELTANLGTPDQQRKFVAHLIAKGHESPLEHASFTFWIDGISRACSHQLVRHRIASYSQRSQRYVDERHQMRYIRPPTCDRGGSVLGTRVLIDDFHLAMADAWAHYRRLIASGVPREDARYVLPNAAATTIVVTMNARSLRNFFRLRLAADAQWEIWELAKRMYGVLEERYGEDVRVLFGCGALLDTK